jgi:aminocarboxymuconate-semialdehyde decarboxylase
MDSALPVCDVHAHYLSPEALKYLDRGAVRVGLETVDGVPDSIVAKGMPVGSTIHQLASVDGIIEGMQAEGLEQRILSPPPFTFRYWEDLDDAVDRCRVLNETLAEVVANQDAFLGLCTVPLQDTDAAIAEFERSLRDLGHVGVTIGTIVGDENLTTSRLEPFFSVVEQAGAPILVHPDFVPSPRLGDYYLVNVVGMPVETATAMANMVFSGMLDRLPELRVCFLHGGGAAPYLYGRWEKGWEVRPEARRDIARPPHEYLRELYCDSLTHSSEALAYLVRVAGADRVVLGTDSPFDVRDPDPRGKLAAAPGLDAAERDQIERRSPFTWLHGMAPEDGGVT